MTKNKTNTSRREFIKRSGAVTATAVTLGACNANSPDIKETTNTAPPNPVPEGEYDYPHCFDLPFAHGVASGDPLKDRVIIWTRISQEEQQLGDNPGILAYDVSWEIGTGYDEVSETITGIVNSGSQTAIAEHDWTVKLDAIVSGVNDGKPSARTYYYQFKTTINSVDYKSVIGRTRTAPSEIEAENFDAKSEVRIAGSSCSSFWSSYWHGYEHMALRDDLDVVVHCGDYIYEFIDADENIRHRRNISDIEYVDNRDWVNLREIRRRYALYRSDPFFNHAHQQHPWVIGWDNHDISDSYGNELPSENRDIFYSQQDTFKVFWEWTPSRPVSGPGGEFLFYENGEWPEPKDQQGTSTAQYSYRHIPYGNLADIFVIDTQYIGKIDKNEGEADQLFGTAQLAWFKAALKKSAIDDNKTWRFVVSQSWLAPLKLSAPIPGSEALLSAIPLEARGDQRPEQRAELFEYMRAPDGDSNNRIHNNIFLGGDMHGNWCSDLVESSDTSNPYTVASVPGANLGVALPNLRPGSMPANQTNTGYYRAPTAPALPEAAQGIDRSWSVGVEFSPTSMGRGGADELLMNASGFSQDEAVAPAQTIAQLLVQYIENLQYMEWVEHGYGIVNMDAEKSLFELWWQNKLAGDNSTGEPLPLADAPDVLGNQLVAWAEEQAAEIGGIARHQDQIDVVTHHGLTINESGGDSRGELAPQNAREMR